jgi:hypothetical protein
LFPFIINNPSAQKSENMKKFTFLFGLSTLLLIVSPAISLAQKVSGEKSARMSVHNEVPDDPYMPSPTGKQLTSPAKTWETSTFFTTQVNVSDGYNILGDAANEPSLAVDPLNTDRMAIGWRQFDYIGSNFRQAGYGFTTDGGETWTFPGVIDPGVFRSDPVLEADNQGGFYYNSLTSSGGSYFCRVYKSDDGGAEWDNGTPAQGGDKQWMEIDKTGGPGDGNIYAYWTSYYSYCYPANFTRSTDGGNSYEDCITVDGNPYWGTLAIGPSGELYAAGASNYYGIVVARSNNAVDPGTYVAWDYYTQVDIDGSMEAGAAVNPGGLLGQAYIAVNNATGPEYGNVYVLASVQRLSNGDPGDVMFAKSEDGGFSFSDPIRINDDFSISNTQWFGTMSVAPNGRIDVVWLDTRDAPSSTPLWSALYYSYSLDGGETWSDNELLSDSFDPHVGWPNQQKMGDYFDMVSDNGNAHLAWANTLNGEQDVYYGRITPVITNVSKPGNENPILTFNISPNPFGENTRLSYNLTQISDVKLVLYDITGAEITTLVNAKQGAGSYSCQLDGAKLKNGIYVCRLSAGGQSRTARLVKVQ